MEQKTSLEISSQGDVTIVSFNAPSISGMAGIEEVSRQINRFISENYPRKMVIDFERVKFFSSQTLGLLMEIWKKLQTYNGQVVISGINPQLHRVFRITNLDKIFQFYPDKDVAVSSMIAG
jgi:anti-anti-sigma factor